MGVERYSSKTDVIVKLILVFFISLLSFSIGTFVGKKFSDNQHKIAQLEPGSHEGHEAPAAGEERSVASVGEAGHDVKPEAALSDAEVAKLAEEFIADDAAPKKEGHGEHAEHGEKAEAHGEKHEEAHAAKAEKHEDAHGEHAPAAAAAAKHEEAHAPAKAEKQEDAHGSVSQIKKDTGSILGAMDKVTRKVAAVADKHAGNEHHEASSAAEKVAEGKPVHAAAAVHEEKKEATKPTSLPKEVATNASGKFTVQIAAYPKEEEAQSMATDLKNKGFSAFYIPAEVKGQTWYRVSVGLFTTQKEADAYKKDLITRAKVSSAIVQKITK